LRVKRLRFKGSRFKVQGSRCRSSKVKAESEKDITAQSSKLKNEIHKKLKIQG